MDLVISQLDRKYQEFLNALDRKSFYDTFRSVYEYFDIIQCQKDLQKIINTERREIEDKKKVASALIALARFAMNVGIEASEPNVPVAVSV